MLLRVSRWAFWLAAFAAAVALAVPTGWETGLTGFAAAASALAYALWRSGLAQVRRAETVHALLPGAAPLGRSVLDDAASMIERQCGNAPTFEAALHAVARVLMTELGALHVTVYRVMGTDATHARVSQMIESQPGFHAAEQRVHLQRSELGQASITLRQISADVSAAGAATGAIVLPVPGPGGVVALIELTGMQLGIEPAALSDLLTLAQTQLERLADPATAARRRAPDAGLCTRLGENA